MVSLSRRNLITGALAAPLAAPPVSTPFIRSCDHDPLSAKAAEWIDVDVRLTAMELEKELESQLFYKAHLMRMDFDVACRSALPRARALRSVDRRIKATHRKLARLAEEASPMASTSIEGALAKVELGIKVQGPFDWRDHALE